MDTFLGVLLGVGLAASCGFRVFVPLLVASVAMKTGYISPAEGFAWMATSPAMICFAVATFLEIVAYYVPWLDNALDTIASPIAMLAGTLLFAASVANLDPFSQWTLAIIAGGGAAGVVQAGSVATRAISTSSTGGLANFLFATFEAIGSLLFSALAIAFPVLAAVLLLVATLAMYYIARHVVRYWTQTKASPVNVEGRGP